MRHDIICNVRNCGFNSPSGFCLNRLTVINNQGVCDTLTKPGWNRAREEEEKSTNFWKTVEDMREDEGAGAGIELLETDSKDGKDGPPRD